MFAALASLLLWALSCSTAPVCEDLVRPLDQLDARQVHGRWALVAGSVDHMASLEALRLRDSITIYISNSSEASVTSYAQVNRFGSTCQPLSYNMSMDASGFTFNVGNRFSLSGSFLRTSCPDCVVMRWSVESSRRTSVDLYLLSRRRMVTQEEMDEYRHQLSCLNLPSPVVMNPDMELCAELSG